jgi:hypothetical protein
VHSIVELDDVLGLTGIAPFFSALMAGITQGCRQKLFSQLNELFSNQIMKN